MAGNPVFAGVSGFCVNGYPRNTWSNIYANTQVSWFQTVTQTVTQIMLTCVSVLHRVHICFGKVSISARVRRASEMGCAGCALISSLIFSNLLYSQFFVCVTSVTCVLIKFLLCSRKGELVKWAVTDVTAAYDHSFPDSLSFLSFLSRRGL